MHFAQLLQFTECADLFGQLFAQTDNIFVDHIDFKTFQFILFLLDEEVYTIKGHPAVVADNPAASVSIRQACNDSCFASRSHLRSICIKNALVMRLANRRKHIYNAFWQIKSISFAGIKDHVNSTERMDRALERLAALHTHNLFFVLIQVARSVRYDRRRRVHINIEYSTGVPLFLR
ncbi:hypothetical protein D3C77_520270 [compost metagenome]